MKLTLQAFPKVGNSGQHQNTDTTEDLLTHSSKHKRLQIALAAGAYPSKSLQRQQRPQEEWVRNLQLQYRKSFSVRIVLIATYFSLRAVPGRRDGLP